MTLGGAASPSAHASVMFPSFVMLRGGGVATPVVLTHAGATGNAILGGPSNISRDTIAIVYGALSLHTPRSVERVRQRRFIEVAEWFGSRPSVDSAGRVAASEFEKANHHSRIYLPGNGEPALWENPVVAPGGARFAFYALGEPAITALESRGFTVRLRR
jgi:hypothetical protein